MPQLVSEKTVRARKEHLCMTCCKPAILPGEEYKRSTYVYDGRIYDWVMCDACRACEGFVFDWCSYIDDGIGQEQYEEWAWDTAHSADSDAASLEQTAAIGYLRRRHGMVADHAWIGVAGHPDDPECSNRADGTDATYCARLEHDHIWSTR